MRRPGEPSRPNKVRRGPPRISVLESHFTDAESAERKARARSAALADHAVDLALGAIRSAAAELDMIPNADRPAMLRAISKLCREAATSADVAAVARANANTAGVP